MGPRRCRSLPHALQQVASCPTMCRGFEYAAAHPDEAAKILCSAVARDTADAPLPEPLDLDMVKQSQRLLSKAGPDHCMAAQPALASAWQACRQRRALVPPLCSS